MAMREIVVLTMAGVRGQWQQMCDGAERALFVSTSRVAHIILLCLVVRLGFLVHGHGAVGTVYLTVSAVYVRAMFMRSLKFLVLLREYRCRAECWAWVVPTLRPLFDETIQHEDTLRSIAAAIGLSTTAPLPDPAIIVRLLSQLEEVLPLPAVPAKDMLRARLACHLARRFRYLRAPLCLDQQNGQAVVSVLLDHQALLQQSVCDDVREFQDIARVRIVKELWRKAALLHSGPVGLLCQTISVLIDLEDEANKPHTEQLIANRLASHPSGAHVLVVSHRSQNLMQPTPTTHANIEAALRLPFLGCADQWLRNLDDVVAEAIPQEMELTMPEDSDEVFKLAKWLAKAECVYRFDSTDAVKVMMRTARAKLAAYRKRDVENAKVLLQKCKKAYGKDAEASIVSMLCVDLGALIGQLTHRGAVLGLGKSGFLGQLQAMLRQMSIELEYLQIRNELLKATRNTDLDTLKLALCHADSMAQTHGQGYPKSYWGQMYPTHKKFKILRAMAEEMSQRLSRAQDTARSKCCICFDITFVREGAECGNAHGKHFICNPCQPAYVQQQLDADLRGDQIGLCSVRCPAFNSDPPCGAPLNLGISASAAAMIENRIVKIRQEMRMEFRGELRRTVDEMKVELEAKLNNRGGGEEAQRYAYYQRRVADLLNLFCPRCEAVFEDFDGCLALTCHSCGCGFCGLCFRDCGADAHQHIYAEHPDIDIFYDHDQWAEDMQALKLNRVRDYIRYENVAPEFVRQIGDELGVDIFPF